MDELKEKVICQLNKYLDGILIIDIKDLSIMVELLEILTRGSEDNPTHPK